MDGTTQVRLVAALVNAESNGPGSPIVPAERAQVMDEFNMKLGQIDELRAYLAPESAAAML